MSFKTKSPQLSDRFFSYWGLSDTVALPTQGNDISFTAPCGVLSHEFALSTELARESDTSLTISTKVQQSANGYIQPRTAEQKSKTDIKISNASINRCEAEYLTAMYRITSGSSLAFRDDTQAGSIARFNSDLSLSVDVGGDDEVFALGSCDLKIVDKDNVVSDKNAWTSVNRTTVGAAQAACVLEPQDDDIDLSAIACVVKESGFFSLVISDEKDTRTKATFAASGNATAIAQSKGVLYIGFSSGELWRYAPKESLTQVKKLAGTNQRHFKFAVFKGWLVSSCVVQEGYITAFNGSSWQSTYVENRFLARSLAVHDGWLYCGGTKLNQATLYRTRDLSTWEEIDVTLGVNVVGLYSDRNSLLLFSTIGDSGIQVSRLSDGVITQVGSVNLGCQDDVINAQEFRGAVYFGASRLGNSSGTNDLFRIVDGVISQAVKERDAIATTNSGINSFFTYKESLFTCSGILKSLYANSITRDTVTSFSHTLDLEPINNEQTYGQCLVDYHIVGTATVSYSQYFEFENPPEGDPYTLIFDYDTRISGSPIPGKIEGIDPRFDVGYFFGGSNDAYGLNILSSQASSSYRIPPHRTTVVVVGEGNFNYNKMSSNYVISAEITQIIRSDGQPDVCGIPISIGGSVDCDRSLFVDNKLYQSKYGLDLSALDFSIDLNVDSSEARLFVDDSGVWSLSEIKKGTYNNSDCSISVVNRRQINTSNKIFTGQIGEIKFNDHQVTLELRSYLQKLQSKSVCKTSSLCRWVFGDAKCRKSLTGLQSDTNITEVVSIIQFKVSGVGLNLKDGEVEFTSGANSGLIRTIQSFENNLVTLWEPLPFIAAVGDQIKLTAGCDKTIQTCGNVYQNQLNFGGFPWVMGKDQYIAGSNRSVSV